MTWIKTIPYQQATGRLKKIYNRLKGPDNKIDNILTAHSLRPHTLEGHLSLYKNVLHHSGNRHEKWFLETIGVYVSMLNHCGYCVDHHFAGLERLLGDEAYAKRIYQALARRSPADVFEEKQVLLLKYAEKLTLRPVSMRQQDIGQLRDVGYDDGEILEANQVIAYFNYANRTVLGLGVTTQGDILGLSPNNTVDGDDWSHR